ncbi:MAG: PilN domain-containing protein, partial [Actinobacteria bacterium]|nr:PilN domain-containing protein [Actinomycetota bacterium]
VATAEAAAPAPEAEKKSALKKEIKLSFRRGVKEPKEAKVKAPKAPRSPRGKRAATTPAVPQVPLMRAFNLLPKDDAREGSRRPNPVQLVLAVVALVLFAGLASAFLLVSSDVSAKEQTVNGLREQLAALDQPQEDPAEIDPADQQLVDERTSRTSALAAAITSRVAWDRLLREVSLVLPEDVWLDTLTAKSPSAPATAAAAAPPATGATAANTFTLTGYTYEQDGVAELLARLSVVPALSNVALASATRAEIGGEDVVQFSITAQVKTVGGGAA